METKKCTTCKVVYPLSEYRKDSSRSNGIHPTCNNCNKDENVFEPFNCISLNIDDNFLNLENCLDDYFFKAENIQS